VENEKYYLKIYAKILDKKIRPTRPTTKLPALLGSRAAVTILLMRVTRVLFLLALLALQKNNQNPETCFGKIFTFSLSVFA
jgi:hypothetical protein